MKIQKLGLALIALLAIKHGFAQDNKSASEFTLKGNLSGTAVDSVLFYYVNSADKYEQVSKPVLNNTFIITGSISQPANAGLLFKNKGEVISREKQENRTLRLYIEPGLMTINGNPASIKQLIITGSKTQTEYADLDAKTSPIRAEEQPIIDALYKEKDHEKAAAIHEQLEPYNARIKKVTYQFFLDHPNSYVTLDMMRYYVSQTSIDSVKKVYNGFNPELKETTQGKELALEIKKIEAGLPGSVAAGFATVDINGKPLSLADFKGKYVMLDFWASWCVPCRKGNPHMISLYNKYKDKGFDIIGVADDDGKPLAWQGAVTKDSIGIWHHVLRGLDWNLIRKHQTNPKDISDKFGIHSLPTKILIDPSGKIIGRFGDSFGGTDDDMDKMLASIFNK